MDTLFWACVLRFVQVVILASFWIVAGCLIAGIFRCLIGPAKLRKLFGGGTGRGLFRGWLMGMLLPVCSLGVIPVARELHRSGIKGGTIIAIAKSVSRMIENQLPKTAVQQLAESCI